MAAVNPNGNEQYYVDGYAFQGVFQNTLIPDIGEELFWVDGYSETNLAPLPSSFTGSFFLMFD